MTITERKQILKHAFPRLDDDALHTLATAARQETYPTGEVLCAQGEPGQTLYVLIAGKTAVYVETDEGNNVMVNTGQPHDYFGEMALLVEGTVRSATIRAQTDCTVLAIDRKPFLQIADQNPALLRHLAVQLTDHLRNNDRLVIHELRQKNRAIKQTYADLAAQEQMRREFVTTLSHELRTPLTSIQGYLQLINKGMIQGESLPVALDSVTRNVEKMVAMTNNLLVLYEMQLTTLEFSQITIADLVVKVVRQVHDTPDYAHATISLEMGAQLPKLYGDEAGLTLALHALIENGVKFSPYDAAVRVRVQQVGQEIRLEVIDKGIGIPAEEQTHIFEPFYRLEHSQKSEVKLFAGIGIGLSIAKFIVERHNGRIEVTSTPNEGSTFTICLPL